ncbi:Ww Domain-Binding Protein 11 [Manis pentadactyla]|nr:Ww Domain-Binding Protein 11 [Manis pentadactyla]
MAGSNTLEICNTNTRLVSLSENEGINDGSITQPPEHTRSPRSVDWSSASEQRETCTLEVPPQG